MSQLKKLLLYGGLERDDFDTLLPDAWKRNARDLNTFSLLAFVIFVALAIANALVGDLTSGNLIYYIAMAAFNGLIYVLVHFAAPKHPGLTPFLTYGFTIALYAFSMRLTLIHPTMPAVTTIALLFAIPFLITDRPLRLSGLTVLVTVAMCVLSLRYKPADVARMDMWNGLTFAVIAIMMEMVQQRARFNSLAQGRKVRYLSETDLLTGAKNRNRFESRQTRYAERCRINLACVYVDVNGLHELNDTRGHRAGDTMLQAVAHSLIDAFGTDNTYRIGGDEFVCFRLDVLEEVTRQDMAEITRDLKKQGYNISVGIAVGNRDGLDIPALIVTAEDEMYRAKREYYERVGKDRRRH